MTDINSKQDLTTYLETRPEKGIAFPDIQYDTPYIISPTEFIKLEQLSISFDAYRNVLLFLHPETHEVFLGDMNEGGHAVVCRIIKIHRQDIFTEQSDLKKWYENRARKMWAT